jgi:hypothetical protein
VSISEDSLQFADEHWAIAAIGVDARSRAHAYAHQAVLSRAVGEQFHLEKPGDDGAECLERLITAYELAALEGLDDAISRSTAAESRRRQDLTRAAAYRAYDLMRVQPMPSDEVHRVLHVLRLGAFAYVGDRWSELRQWFVDNTIEEPGLEARWDMQLLSTVYSAWLALLRKRDWKDLSSVASSVASLREAQAEREPELFGALDESELQPTALRLAALYHWAKATETLGEYMLQGTPAGVDQDIDKHFESASRAAQLSGDFTLEMVLRWLHLCSRTMITGSVWWVARTVNSRVTGYVERMTKEQALFELLPPQRVAIREQGLLDAASRAVVVDLPTSGGKTLLAEFRILQALNQFDADRGWVAYVAPTRALAAQLTRRLRRHLEPVVRVEQLTGAVEIDSVEQDLLNPSTGTKPFDVLVTTPEKLQLVLRNGGVSRPLALLVVDEAHNLEDEVRGLRIELLIATVKRECPHAAFLLLMPKVPNADELANWLDPEAGRTVSLGTTAWRPNDRVIGMYSASRAGEGRGDWQLQYETLIPDLGSRLVGTHPVGDVRPLPVPLSQASNCLSLQTAAMCGAFCSRGPVVGVAQKIPDVWSMARRLRDTLEILDPIPEDIRLVQQFLRSEVSERYELVDMLAHGVGVHHSELSDEARCLIEWLAERRQLRVLCATTTIAQGVNFPISAVFLASHKYPYGVPMSHRAFWNLAGRAGRVGQDAVGVVGIAAGSHPDEVRKFVSDVTGKLVSRLVSMIEELEKLGEEQRLVSVFHDDSWIDFRCYVAHLWNEKQSLDAVLSETEQLLRSTYGYGTLRSGSEADKDRARLLLEATRAYAISLAEHPENASLADATGFAPDGVVKALLGLSSLEKRLTAKDWEPSSIFGDHGSALPELFGVMMRLPQIGEDLEKLASRSGLSRKRVADIARAWVSGSSIEEIAKQYFKGVDTTKSIGATCKAIYKTLANNGTWGLSALSKMPTAGIDWSSLTDDDRRRLNNVAAMLYHGVQTENAILMRMNGVPRSVAEPLGQAFESAVKSEPSPADARTFLKRLEDRDWERARPASSVMSGHDYRQVWMVLSGEGGTHDSVPNSR